MFTFTSQFRRLVYLSILLWHQDFQISLKKYFNKTSKEFPDSAEVTILNSTLVQQIPNLCHNNAESVIFHSLYKIIGKQFTSHRKLDEAWGPASTKCIFLIVYFLSLYQTNQNQAGMGLWTSSLPTIAAQFLHRLSHASRLFFSEHLSIPVLRGRHRFT